MSALFFALAVFCIGLIILVKGADWLVKGGAGLAARWGVSSGVIGFTIIAFGTSLPEFFVTTGAMFMDKTDIGLGNVVGSNLFNIGFILALCIILKPMAILGSDTRRILWQECGLTLLATGLYVVMAYRGILDMYSSAVFLVVFSAILLYISRKGLAQPEEGLQSHGKWDYILTVTGVSSVIVGSSLFLSGAVELASIFHIPTYIIGLSVVAAGTSIPELVTSLVAMLRGYGGVSAGNILGSNYFNLLFILGIGGLIHPIPVPEQQTTVILMGITLCLVPLFAFKNTWVIRLCCLGIFMGYCLYLFNIFS